MNCLEFEGHWNELLDGHLANAEGLDRELESHASTCQCCRAALTGYQILRQAVSAIKPPPNPSPASIERLYALTVPSKPRVKSSNLSISLARIWVPLSVAAAVFAMVGLGVIWRPSGKPMEPALRPVPEIASTTAAPVKALGVALAEATEATIDLARETSADASRIGRELFEIGKDSVEVPDLRSARVAEIPAKSEADPATSDRFRTVGDRWNSGVGPISSSAHHAFGFLLGQAGEPGPSPAPPSRRGSL